MDTRSMLAVLDRILDDSKVAVLATVDNEGRPRMRWMTPATKRGREGALYAVTAPEFAKVVEVTRHPQVEWMFQSKTLDEIVTVRGSMQVLDHPRTKAEVLEAIGGNLGIFWRINHDASDLVVLETTIEEIVYFKPLTGERTATSVKQEMTNE